MKQSITLKPFQMCLAEKLDIFPTLSPTNSSTDGEKNHIEEGVRDFGCLTRVFKFGEELGKCRLMVHDETPVKESIRSHPVRSVKSSCPA